jgi:photosynthetic reaction center cytochrome c subunit
VVGLLTPQFSRTANQGGKMKLGSRRKILNALGTMLVGLLGVTLANGQARPEPKPQMAEEVFKNIQVLKGITVNEFMETMGFFSASTLLNCADCHTKESSGDWEKYADDTELKRTARKMVMMMRGINQSFFGGRRMITCYSCHRGDERPKVTPNLDEMYATPPPQEPEQILEQAPGAPTADQLFDKYIQALGGAQRVAGLTSIVAKGIYDGSPVSQMTGESPLEIYAKAPGQRAMIVHSEAGDATTTYDGRTAWSAAPALYVPVPVVPLVGSDLDAAKVEAELAFPARIKQTLSQLRVGFPATINNREVDVVQGTSAGKLPVKLYFDKQSGLLVRLVRYTDLPVGFNPIQTDYADYREVSGVKMPFRIIMTWVDGQATLKLSDVQVNAPIDAAKFARPAPPTPPKTATK